MKYTSPQLNKSKVPSGIEKRFHGVNISLGRQGKLRDED